jgi:hypothetical protein
MKSRPGCSFTNTHPSDIIAAFEEKSSIRITLCVWIGALVVGIEDGSSVGLETVGTALGVIEGLDTVGL